MAIQHHQGPISGTPPNIRPQTRTTQRVERRDGGRTVKVGTETIHLAQLCPSRLARAIHRRMIDLMQTHPETFPVLSMCTRTTRSDMSIAIAYGTDRQIVPLELARAYLERLLDGHTGRHDDPQED